MPFITQLTDLTPTKVTTENLWFGTNTHGQGSDAEALPYFLNLWRYRASNDFWYSWPREDLDGFTHPPSDIDWCTIDPAVTMYTSHKERTTDAWYYDDFSWAFDPNAHKETQGLTTRSYRVVYIDTTDAYNALDAITTADITASQYKPTGTVQPERPQPTNPVEERRPHGIPQPYWLHAFTR